MTDLEWLENKLGRPVSENEIEHFGERVSIILMDRQNWINRTSDDYDAVENEARELTLRTWIR